MRSVAPGARPRRDSSSGLLTRQTCALTCCMDASRVAGVGRGCAGAGSGGGVRGGARGRLHSEWARDVVAGRHVRVWRCLH